MAWPKRKTRRIVVDGEELLWHGVERCACCMQVLTVGKPGAPYVLFIDPFVWSMEIRPGSVANAVRWARAAGWSPEHGPTRAMALDEVTQGFRWLADGQRHAACPKS
jgi:hypothetical protein